MAEEMAMVPLAGTKKEETPDPPERRRALVKEVQARVRAAKSFHEKPFKQMKADIRQQRFDKEQLLKTIDNLTKQTEV